jgi:hypothetical protein
MTWPGVLRTVNITGPNDYKEHAVNLSERLAKAAMERGRQTGGSAQRVDVTTLGSASSEPPREASTSALLPDLAGTPIEPGKITVMKMRLPEPVSPTAGAEQTSGLPIWERPVLDVMREAGLATVTSLPVAPRDENTANDDRADGGLAETIPMRGSFMAPAIDRIDLTEFHVPPLALSESQGLASGSLSAQPDDDGSHAAGMINLDDLTIDAEIVDVDRASADALLDRWSEDVNADVHDRQERVDDLYRLMVDTVQHQRVTFGPIDLRDEIRLPSADGEHTCPQCGARARIDIHDPMRGRIHLSCDSCFKMWQQRVEATVHSDEPFMRD